MPAATNPSKRSDALARSPTWFEGGRKPALMWQIPSRQQEMPSHSRQAQQRVWYARDRVDVPHARAIIAMVASSCQLFTFVYVFLDMRLQMRNSSSPPENNRTIFGHIFIINWLTALWRPPWKLMPRRQRLSSHVYQCGFNSKCRSLLTRRRGRGEMC